MLRIRQTLRTENKLGTNRALCGKASMGRRGLETDDLQMWPVMQMGTKSACDEHQASAMEPGHGANLR